MNANVAWFVECVNMKSYANASLKHINLKDNNMSVHAQSGKTNKQ